MELNPFDEDGDGDSFRNKVGVQPGCIPRKIFLQKYRPKCLQDIYLPAPLYNKIHAIHNINLIPNMLITGHPGTGKTITIKQLAKHIYGKYYHEAVLELNASDNRGLEIINNSIIYFCRKKLLNENQQSIHKLVIMDEADNITKKAQNMISNFMEEYGANTNFVFTCNDSSKLIEAIQSRCVILYFPSVSNEMIVKKLGYICQSEGIEYEEEAIEQISQNSSGDMRQAILNLEMIYYGGQKCDVETVRLLNHRPQKHIIIEIIKMCASRKLMEAIDIIHTLKKQGYCNSDIILNILNMVQQVKIDDDVRMKYIEHISRSYINISDGLDSNLQLYGCLSNLVLI